LIVFAFGSRTSGVPPDWAATNTTPGVNFLKDYSAETLNSIKVQIAAVKKPGDIIVFSVHWGSNWGYDIPAEQKQFARQLIDQAGVDVVHGHSSHHPKGLEVYKNHLIIYGAGDFLNDYEGISGHDEFRDDLTVMYFASLDPKSGELIRLRLVPMHIRNFRLNRPSRSDAKWLQVTLDRECRKLGTRVVLGDDGRMELHW